jgi:signal transduction histidine kinase/CheY-like chemotaxis protein
MGTDDCIVAAFQNSDIARTLFLESGDALFVVDPLTERVVEANPAAQKLSQATREDLLRLTVRDVVRHEQGRQDWLQTVQQASTSHGQTRPAGGDGYLLRSGEGDSWTPVSLTVSPLPLADAPALALLTFRDRGEQVDAYRRVQRTEAELRRVLVSVSDCLYSYRIDPRGVRRYRYLSPVVERLSGRPVSHFLDDPLRWGDVIDPEDRPRWREFALGLASRPAGSVELEYRVRRPDGTARWVREAATVAAPDEGPGQVVHGILTDVTERRHAETAAEERRQARGEKMDSLFLMAGSLAHDFNNLLTGVLGNAGLARMMLAPDSEAHGPLEQVEAGALRAAQVCRQLLTFAGNGRMMPIPVGLNAVAEETAGMLRGSLATAASLDLELATGLPDVTADPGQVREALVNLIVNAAEAVEEQGTRVCVRTFAVRCGRAASRSAHFASRDLPEGEAVALEVLDDGPGVTAEVRARMFEPFFTTKFHGRGLGLAVVLGVVRAHRGAIFVESTPGRGTAVRLVLPCAAAEVPRRPEVVEEPPAQVVLVVDDEEAVRAVTRRMLEAAGYRVLVAEDGVQALEMYRRHRDVVRLALVDLTMPRMHGEDALRALRDLRRDLPVVLMSGYAESDVMGRFAGAGPSAFLQKPFRPVELLEAVRRHVLAERPG